VQPRTVLLSSRRRDLLSSYDCFDKVSGFGVEFDAVKSRSAFVEAMNTVRSERSSYDNVCSSIDGPHFGTFSAPFISVILNDTERIDPNILNPSSAVRFTASRKVSVKLDRGMPAVLCFSRDDCSVFRGRLSQQWLRAV